MLQEKRSGGWSQLPYLTAALEAQFYFAHRYASWERVLNENTNGLIRQDLKKGCDFSPITEIELAKLMNKLNNRPQKGLNYSTPNEVFALYTDKNRRSLGMDELI